MNKRAKFAVMILIGVAVGSVLTMLSSDGIAASDDEAADGVLTMLSSDGIAASDAGGSMQSYGTVLGDIKVTQHPNARGGATITVTGMASQNVEPDTLRMNLGVHTTDTTAQEALRANTELMDSTIGALTDAGVSEDEIQTERFTIYPDYNSYELDGTWTSKLAGFSVDNSIVVKTAMIDSAGMLIDTAVQAGANRIDYVQFELSDQERQKINDEMIASALQNAEDRANSILAPYNYTISGIKSINTGEFSIHGGYEVFADYDIAALSAASSIYQSDQTVTARAYVTYYIEEISP